MMKRTYALLFAALSFACAANLAAQSKLSDENREEGNAPLKRIEWYYMQRSYPNGIPAGARLNALRETRAMQSAATRNAGARIQATTWQPMGPANAGGRIEALAVAPTSGTLYIGAAEGGVWRGVPGGNGYIWSPLTDNADALAMGALALDPHNEKIIYAGTGEWTMAYGGNIYSGAGILKSIDGGDSWANMGLSGTASFSRIIVDPDNSNIVWAAGFNGLWRSSDAGASWNALVKDSACCDLALDPNDHTRLYVAIQNNGVYGVRDNQPTTFIRLSNGFPTGITYSDTSVGRIALASANDNGTTVVYAVVASLNSWFKGVYKLSGISWVKLTSPSPLMIQEGQGWYDLTIAASPANANNVVVAGDLGIFNSNNGGASWTLSSIAHPDHHAILFDPSGDGTVYEGNDGGVFLSGDNGATFQNISNGLAITQFYGIDADQTQANTVYGGSQDNGTWGGGASQSWNPIPPGGDGGMTKVDLSNNQAIYMETLANGGLYRSSVTGGGFSLVMTNATFTGDRSPWVRAIALDPNNTSALLAGTDRIYRSVNYGSSLAAISPDLTRGNLGGQSTLSAIAVCPSNSNVIWAGTNDGLIHVTADGGANWMDVSQGLSGRAVTHIMPISDNTAYAAFSGFGPAHVMKTTNQGASWTDITSNLPDVPVNAIANDPAAPTHLFVGTDVDVFYSMDDGATWAPYMDGLPNVVVADLVVQRQTGMLVAGTYGRSVWQAPMNASVLALGAPLYGPTWFTGNTYSIVWYGIPAATVYYSTDDGATWTTIERDVSAPAYQWEVPGGINTTKARIKIESAAATLESDPFTIRPPQTGDVTQTTAVPFVPYTVTFDGNNLWCTSFYERKIYTLDPDFLSVRGTIPAPGDSCTGIVYDADSKTLYVHELNGTGNNKIFHLDTSGNVLQTFHSPTAYATGIAYDGASLFAVDRDNPAIYAIDPTTGSSVGKITNPVYSFYGPRGLSLFDVTANSERFLHVVTQFTGAQNTLQQTYLYRLQYSGNGFAATDSTPLTYEGGTINARGIQADPRYPNAYWITDFGSGAGNSGSIYRIVGFDLQSLDIALMPDSINLLSTTTQTISWTATWKSTPIAAVNLLFSSDDGATWNSIASNLPATQGSYTWTLPDITAPKCKVRVADAASGAIRSTSNIFALVKSNGVAERFSTPDGFALAESSPDPVRSAADIAFTFPRASSATLRLYDASGARALTLASGEFGAGVHRVRLDAAGLPSGAYTCILQTPSATLSRGVVICK